MRPNSTFRGPRPSDPPAWYAHVAPGHVVAFALPSGGRRRLDPEPYVVLELTTLGGRPAIVAAPGLPATGRRRGRQDLYVTSDDLAAVRGLHAPFLFLADRRLVLLATHAGLAEAALDGSPILGRLGQGALDRLTRVQAGLNATHAAARRHLHRRRRGGAIRGRDFKVVARHPARRRLGAAPRRGGTV